MIRQIVNALTQVLLCFSAQRSQLEAMIKIDFKLGHEKDNLMQLCFSNLGNWPIFVVSLMLLFEPFRYSWSLQKLFSQLPSISFFLLDGRWQNMIIFALIFFIAEWILRSQQILILTVIYFILKSDIHVNLAAVALVAIVFSNGCRFWWLHFDLKSRSWRIWKTYCQLQIFGCSVGGIFCLWLLNYFHQQGYFSGSMTENRFAVILLFIAIIYFSQFVITAIWGHFSFKTLGKPAEFPVHYSTANWILRIPITSHFKMQLARQTKKYMELHKSNLQELTALKDLSPAAMPIKISEILNSELEYLKLASSRLTSE